MKALIQNTITTFAAILVIGGTILANDLVRTPDLPVGCERLKVDGAHKLSFRAYAVGVQIYRWNGTTWDFVAPLANLYADRDFHIQIGDHYAGPTWEGNWGSNVVGRRVDGCTPDATAIPWLLLDAASTEGPGIFHRVTYIQRVKTAGGLVPSAPGTTVGEEARVPYSTEYYFYRRR